MLHYKIELTSILLPVTVGERHIYKHIYQFNFVEIALPSPSKNMALFIET
jgi:hypothetical protein